jgi:hypothetical protein
MRDLGLSPRISIAEVVLAGSERAVGRLRGEPGIVRHFEPIDEPDAAFAGGPIRDFHALAPDALFLVRVGATAVGEKPPVLGAKVVGAPLPAASVELANASTGDHQIELVAADIAAGSIISAATGR